MTLCKTACAALVLCLAGCGLYEERIPERHVAIRHAPMVDLPPAFQP